MAKAIGMIEYKTVASGMTAADLMVKTAEVDVIQEEANKIKAFEIKSAERFNQEFTKSLSYVQKLLGDEISSSYRLTNLP